MYFVYMYENKAMKIVEIVLRRREAKTEGDRWKGESKQDIL
jgi:hypothetical protein